MLLFTFDSIVIIGSVVIVDFIIFLLLFLLERKFLPLFVRTLLLDTAFLLGVKNFPGP